jgi:hypothetical protein
LSAATSAADAASKDERHRDGSASSETAGTGSGGATTRLALIGRAE